MPTQAYASNRSVRDNLSAELTEVYDFAVHGGLVSTITLPSKLPLGAVITEGYAIVQIPGTSGGSATVALGLNTNTDLLGSATGAVANLTANAVIPLLPNLVAGTVGNSPVRLTAERQLKVTIGTAALTAGKIVVHLKYVGPFEIQPVTTLP